MSGKSTGLNTKLRKLLARIQKDFHFPKVIAVKCAIRTPVNTFQDDAKVTFHQVEPVAVELLEGTLGGAVCHRVPPMESMTAQINQVTCWGTQLPRVHAAGFDHCLPQVRVAPLGLSLDRVCHYPITKPRVSLRRNVPKVRVVVRHHTALARNWPIQLELKPMHELSKKLQIRYRSSVLKLLNLRPDQVVFLGVATGLPQAPVRLAELIEEKDQSFAMAKVVGPPNPLFGQRAWVMVQTHGRDQILPITLKEE